MRRFLPLKLALLTLLIGACVTINVYFPAAAAENVRSCMDDDSCREYREREAILYSTKDLLAQGERA